ncbi:MAG: ATP-binding cassette domain-containing protein [Aerococcus sp.]|nr:ATP-binding cassette domain-containing protein [Aerococcus sp.]
MEVIKLMDVSKVIQGCPLFHIDQAVVNTGDKIGLIGKNGTGKSTLLKMIVGLDAEYQGQIHMNRSFAYLPQMKVKSQESGGEQTKRMIEEVLAERADLLILDEPSANLDQENVHWLIQTLENYPGTLIVVSHDRSLLNQVVNQIWALEQGQLNQYVGTYEDYHIAKRQERESQVVAYANYNKKVHQLKAEAKKRNEHAKRFKQQKKNQSASDYKVNGYAGKYDGHQKSIAKSAKALEKRIEQLEKVERPPKALHYTFKAVGNLSDHHNQTLIHLKKGKVRQGKHWLFTFPEFTLKGGEKISLEGPNQAGKTTFLRQLFNQTLPGYYKPDLSIGYFAQDFTNLALEQSVLDNVQKSSLQSDTLIRTVLASLGFSSHKLGDLVQELSGGERVRLSFAKLLLGDYHLLLLDEPTNFLDLGTLEQVEKFILEHPAAIILVSHDQAFIEHTVHKRYVIDNQRLLSPDYLDYPDKKQDEIALLEFRLQQMIMDEDVSLDEIKQVQKQMKRLKDKWD